MAFDIDGGQAALINGIKSDREAAGADGRFTILAAGVNIDISAAAEFAPGAVVNLYRIVPENRAAAGRRTIQIENALRKIDSASK